MNKEDELLTQIERLKAANAALLQRLRVTRKFLRDSYMGAVLSGLASNWSWENTKADRLAAYAEDLVNCILRRRKAWEEEKLKEQP